MSLCKLCDLTALPAVHEFCLPHASCCANVGPGLLTRFLSCMNGSARSLEAKKQTLAQGEEGWPEIRHSMAECQKWNEVNGFRISDQLVKRLAH